MGKRREREHRGIVNTERDEGQGWSFRGKRVGMRSSTENKGGWRAQRQPQNRLRQRAGVC